MKTRLIKHSQLSLMSLLLLALGHLQARADYLPNNFWPNPGFENGSDLDAVDGSGTPTGWNRGGSDGTICQVIATASISPTHALAATDNNPSGYGEWYSDWISLSGHANPGDLLNVQWHEMYDITSGEMRLTVGWSDASGNFISETHFVATGSSVGWSGAIGSSTFTKRTQSLAVPSNAARIRISLVSGGPEETLGVIVVDDLSVALQPQPVLLAGNFWPNPSFETGTSLDIPTGTPTGWNRGGNDSSLCQVSTNNYVSTGHALGLVDSSATGYGEWFSDVALSGHANPGDTLSLQWFELYSVTNGEMRLSILFFDSGDSVVGQQNFLATGQSASWQGSIAASGFTRRTAQLVVPANAVKMRASLVSGGPTATTGIMLIDDLSVALPPPPPLLSGNFWPNPTFEAGSNLNQPTGTPTGWVRAGDNTNLCLVTTDNASSPTHALAVIDTDENAYGEWDADVLLAGNASPGDWLDLQWSELYAVTNGEMRLTILFFDGTDAVVGQADAMATGQSAGWQGSIATSSFTVHKLQLMVPYNAVRLRVSLVSGGPLFTTGLMVLDDLSVARHPYPSTVLAYDFFPNPTFEEGAQMDSPTVGLPAGGWQRGGSDATIDQVLTNNSVSPSHSLALIDNSPGNYGEWYLFYNLAGAVGDDDAVDIQWYQIFSTTNGSMRLSFAFLDGTGATLVSQDFNTSGQSPGWTGNIATSPFQQQFQRLAVPPGSTRLRINFASGGAATVTGIMVIDDLSIRKSMPLITGLSPVTEGNQLTWNSMASKTYTVLYTDTLSATPVWTPLVIGLASGGLTTAYSDTTTHAGSRGFYRVVQE